MNIIDDDIRKIISDDKIEWSKLQGKKIFVTGSTGFLMNYFIRLILDANRSQKTNCKVFAYCRSITKASEIFSNYLDDQNLMFIEGDIGNINDIDDSIDYIIHAASPANPFYWSQNPVNTIITNVQGTHNILEFAKKTNAQRTLIISSASVYGDNNRDIQFGETDTNGEMPYNNPRFCYNESKRVCELLSNCYVSHYDMDIVIARPFIVYGPGTDINRKTAFSDFMQNIMHKQDIILKSDGSAKRDYCYISDCISGLLYVLLCGKKGEAYNIANSEETLSIRQLAEKFSDYSRKNSKVIVDIPSNISYLNAKGAVIRANTDKIKSLGWMHTVNMDEGIRRTMQFMSE